MSPDEVTDQMKFVRKVYSILCCQLTLTSAFIFLVQSDYHVRNFCIVNNAIAIIACVLSLVFLFMLVCCFHRSHPINYALLFGFTVCETYMVGGLTASYDPKTVMMAGLATALVSISLTIYAMKTKVNIEIFYAMTFVIYLAMLPLIIISFVIQLKALYILYCCLGLLFYSIFLIIDTMTIVKGKSLGGYECSHDDAILGALMLYIDIIMIFVYLLRLLGGGND